jgi:hypothetical protein
MTLVDQLAGPNGDIADLHRLLTGQWPAQGEYPALRRIKQDWQSPALLHEALARRSAEGYKAALVLGETTLFEALKLSGSLPALLPIVPNIQGLMRDAVEYGMVRAGLRRVWRAGALTLAGMGLRNLSNLGAIKRRDFPVLLQGFIEVELASFNKFNPPAFLLQAQMTDLAIATHNPRLLEAFFKSVRQRSSAAPGLITHNAAATVAALKTWGLEPALLITPCGAEPGWARPDNEAAAHALKAAGLPGWADRRLTPSPPTPADRESFRKAGLFGACRDDLALWLTA